MAQLPPLVVAHFHRFCLWLSSFQYFLVTKEITRDSNGQPKGKTNVDLPWRREIIENKVEESTCIIMKLSSELSGQIKFILVKSYQLYYNRCHIYVFSLNDWEKLSLNTTNGMPQDLWNRIVKREVMKIKK